MKPKPELKESAESLLKIVFEGDDDESRMAATTLIEIIAPDILHDSIPKKERELWGIEDLPTHIRRT
jgi:hypothetical protein